MATKKKDRGPTSGGRFKRAYASTGKGSPAERKRHPSNGPSMNRAAGEHMLTPELQEKMIRMIQSGSYAEVAARACGINGDTFYKWLLRGGRGEQPFAALAEAVDKAAAESEVRDVALIGKHAETDWRAAAHRLERKNHKRWGRKDQLELSGNEDKPVVVSVIKWGDDEIEFDG